MSAIRRTERQVADGRKKESDDAAGSSRGENVIGNHGEEGGGSLVSPPCNKGL